MSGFEDVVTGAITSGVNLSTFIAINALLLCAVLAVIGLLFVSLHSAPALVPHALFLLFLALGLWGLVFWFIGSVVGLVNPEQQRKELAGATGADQPEQQQQQQQQQAGSKKQE